MDIKYLRSPDKSVNDKKGYSVFQLPNGLLVLLVSNENDSYDKSGKTQAACALRINVGYFSDPSDINGLAHLLEHMTFMEAKKKSKLNRKRNSYNNYIKTGGGIKNAVTGPESTTFYFSICQESLDGALEMFAAPFVTPLIHQKSIDKQLEAVNSEFVYISSRDDMRRNQILADSAIRGHPCRVFGNGNFKTLQKEISKDDLLGELYRFRQKHYSANRMFLCLQAGLPLKMLEELVVKHFSAIPCNNLPLDDCSGIDYINSFNQEFYNNVYFVKSVSDACKLELSWILPPVLNVYKSKPHFYLIYLLQYSGPGSVVAYLKNRFWIQNMSAGFDPGFGNNSIFSMFTLRFHLTQNGLNNLNEILGAIFSYIKLIKKCGPNKKIFFELEKINCDSFQYHNQQRDVVDSVLDLVECLQNYPSREILTAPNSLMEYNEVAIFGILHRINNSQFNIMITTGKKFQDVVYNKKEKWYGTNYTMKEIPKEWILLWNHPKSIPELYFPRLNKFLVNDFTILWKELGMPKCSEFPRKIIDNEICEIWFRQDDKFLLPMAYMCFKFITPMPRVSEKNSVLAWLYCLLIKHQISMQLYPANVAGLFYQQRCTDDGLILMVHGYNEKLDVLVDIISMHMALLPETLNDRQFNEFLMDVRCTLHNSLIKPSRLNMDIRQCIVHHERLSLLNRYNILMDINLNDMKEFSSNLFKEVKIQSLFQGNLIEETAYKAINTILRNLKCSSIANPILMQHRSCQIPLGTNYIKCRSLNVDDKTSVVLNFYQIGPCTLRNVHILTLFKAIIEKPLFEKLCKEKHLGDKVSFNIQLDNGILGYIIILHSNKEKVTANYIDEKIEHFRSEMINILQDMDNNNYEEIHQSLIASKQVADKELGDEVKRNWREISKQDYVFDRHKKELECFRTIRKEDIIEFITEAEKDVHKLSIQVIGNMSTESSLARESYEIPSVMDLNYIEDENAIQNIAEFKKDLFVFPVTKLVLECL